VLEIVGIFEVPLGIDSGSCHLTLNMNLVSFHEIGVFLARVL
jgi:hypothetical protein